MQALEMELKTVADIEALPEGVRAELIDGVMYDMAAPSGSHQKRSILNKRISKVFVSVAYL